MKISIYVDKNDIFGVSVFLYFDVQKYKNRQMLYVFTLLVPYAILNWWNGARYRAILESNDFLINPLR